MRITNNMLVNNMMYFMNNNLSRLQKYQAQIATGKKIEVPSDDPIVAAKALKLRTDVSEVDQFKKNANDANSWMNITESSLSDTVDILQRGRELAVQAANNTLTPSDRDKIKQEIIQLKGQAIHLSNATYAGRYVFSGYETDTKLMNDDGSYNCSVSSNQTAVVKGGLTGLSSTNTIDTAVNSSFQISIDGANYYSITVPAATYNGTAGGKLDDLAKSIQNTILTSPAAVGTAPAAPPASLSDIQVVNNNGRIEFSLRNTMDPNGNRMKIFMKKGIDNLGTNDILDKLNIKTDPVTLSVVSKSEDINYQVGISDMLNINVLGSDLYGSGKKGDVGDFINTFNRYIDALTYPDDKKSYVSSQQLTANAASKIDLSGTTYQFGITIGATTGTVSLPPKVYDGTAGKTLNDLATDIAGAIFTATGISVDVVNQNGQITINDPGGNKITLKEGAPGKDPLNLLKFYTDANKTVSSVTSGEGINNAITNLESLRDNVMSIRADIGARTNRADLTVNRLETDNINFTKLMSDNEDVDMAEAITNMQNEQNVYRSSLAVGAKIIQPSLIDFLR